jgi:DNA-directed RNA polymerase subunit RPC12/RpoP
MAKEYEVKCPYCKNVRKMVLSDFLSSIMNTNGMRGTEEEKPKPPSPESANEENWIDLKSPCPNCSKRFSYNIVTGESRE